MSEFEENPRETITKAILSASSRNSSLSRLELNDALDRNESALRSDYDLFANVLGVALSAQNFDVASDLIGRRCGVLTRFDFEMGDTGNPEVLRWEVLGRYRSRITISSQWWKQTVSHIYFAAIIVLLGTYCASDEPETGAVFINIGDYGYVPGLAFSDSRPDYFLIPDPIFLIHRGYEWLRHGFNANDVAWDQRTPIAFWRGGTSGSPVDPALGWRSLPRIQLCHIAEEYPELIDAGISHAGQCATDEDVRAAGLMRPRAPMESFNKYKYQIDIDGNTNSWPGLFQKLLSGSPVLKVKSRDGYQQWYYDQLKPWVNFVPVVSDMSDLVEKILWLRANDAAARQIGEAGKQLADSLDYHGEIERSLPIITGALRYFSDKPQISLRFGAGQSDNRFLTQGWGEPVVEAVPTVGCVSGIVAPRPIGKFAYDLNVEVSPRDRPATPIELGIAVNGTLIRQEKLIERGVIKCGISAELLECADDLRISLLHPGAGVLVAADRPSDEQIGSLALHGLTVTAAVTEGALLRLLPSPTFRPAEGTGPTYLLTHHGRLLGCNEAGDLMQVDLKPEARPRFLEIHDPVDGEVIQTGPLAGFRLSSSENGVHFEKNGHFLCAEPHGALVANRPVADLWETFTLVSVHKG